MSPEQDDDKLFAQETDHQHNNTTTTTLSLSNVYHFSNSLERLFTKWNQLQGQRWTDDIDLLPTHLTSSERATALQELRSIKEYFYTTTKLPVITPDNAKDFMSLISNVGFDCIMFSLYSGSSRLLLTMTGLGFSKCVLFPIDLRYRWDLGHKEHQQLIVELDTIYKPRCTSAEPRCKHWSISGNRRDPTKTETLRSAEIPQHKNVSGQTLSAAHRRQKRRTYRESTDLSDLEVLSDSSSQQHSRDEPEHLQN